MLLLTNTLELTNEYNAGTRIHFPQYDIYFDCHFITLGGNFLYDNGEMCNIRIVTYHNQHN